MSGYLVRRLMISVPTLLIIVTIAFFMMRVAPGGPFDQERALPPEIERNMLAAYNLDAPLVVQYWDYLKGVVHGDFGPSFKYQDFTVAELLLQGFPASLKVGGIAIALAVVIGITLGTIAALRQNSGIDYAVMATAMTGITIPNFVMAPLLTLVLGVYLGWLPVAGWGGGAPRFLILPVIALALPQIAYVARLTRGSMIETLNANFVRTARAKGLREQIVVVRHALRGALLPVVSYLGPATAQIMTGSVVIETIFGIPGIGRYFVQGALNRDYTLVMGTVIVYGVLIIAAQSRGRPALRPARPEGEAAMSIAARQDVLTAAAAVQGRSLWQDARRRLFRNKAAVVSMVLLAIIAGMAAAAPWLSPHAYDAVYWERIAAPPDFANAHWFGTDGNGRDLFVRTLYGARVSLMVGILATGVSLLIGITWGAIAGYFGGHLDNLMMRFVDVMYSLPFMFFVILLMVVFGRNIFLIFIAIGAVEWLTMARIVRGQTLSVKGKEFIEAARAAGVPNRKIIRRHIIPNLLGPVVVYVTLTVPQVILIESFLSFLGLGVQEPLTSWGVLIEEGAANMESSPWMLIYPATFLAVTLFCFNFIGDGLRDALDPKDR